MGLGPNMMKQSFSYVDFENLNIILLMVPKTHHGLFKTILSCLFQTNSVIFSSEMGPRTGAKMKHRLVTLIWNLKDNLMKPDALWLFKHKCTYARSRRIGDCSRWVSWSNGDETPLGYVDFENLEYEVLDETRRISGLLKTIVLLCPRRQ
jgi:hypothetical protein